MFSVNHYACLYLLVQQQYCARILSVFTQLRLSTATAFEEKLMMMNLLPLLGFATLDVLSAFVLHHFF